MVAGTVLMLTRGNARVHSADDGGAVVIYLFRRRLHLRKHVRISRAIRDLILRSHDIDS